MSRKAEKCAALLPRRSALRACGCVCGSVCVCVPISFLLCCRPTHTSAHVAEYAGMDVEARASVVRRSPCGVRWLPLVVT